MCNITGHSNEVSEKSCSFEEHWDVCSFCQKVLMHVDRRFAQIELKEERRFKDRRTSSLPVEFQRRRN